MRLPSRALSVAIFSLVVAVLFGPVPGLRAQEPLRWKFEPGQKLAYNMVQDMTMSTSGPFGQQNVMMNQVMEMTWEVKELNDQGEAVISQKFDRMKMKMTLPPPLGVIEYDSKSEGAPAGPAAMFAPMFKALSQAEFELTMTPRGEIKDVKVPEEVIAALKNSPGAAAMGDLATPDGFKKMISNGALVLPENAPQPGDEWSTKVELNMPGSGKQIVETTYRFEGMKEVDGVQYAAFRPDLKMTFEGNPQMTVKDQESNGEILFNVEAGRLHSSSLNQKLTMTQAAGVEAKIDQTIKVTVTPAEEAAGGAEAESQE
jgi:hypothetical protein